MSNNVWEKLEQVALQVCISLEIPRALRRQAFLDSFFATSTPTPAMLKATETEESEG